MISAGLFAARFSYKITVDGMLKITFFMLHVLALFSVWRIHNSVDGIIIISKALQNGNGRKQLTIHLLLSKLHGGYEESSTPPDNLLAEVKVQDNYSSFNNHEFLNIE